MATEGSLDDAPDEVRQAVAVALCAQFGRSRPRDPDPALLERWRARATAGRERQDQVPGEP